MSGTNIKPSVIAIIPARSGSKGVRDKNLAELGGFPLIAYSIVAAKLAGEIERVLVSTDSYQYATLARAYGAETPFLRPEKISGDHATDRDFMVHAMEWLKEHEGHVPEYWVHLRPTTPLRDPALLNAAIQAIKGCPEATSLRSAHPAPESPFKWFRRNEAGYLTALTSDDTSLDKFNLPRQGYPQAFVPDGYVDIVRASFVLKSGLLHGNRVLGYESPFCIEVDTQEELDLLNLQLCKHGSLLLEYLKTHFKDEANGRSHI